MCQLATLIFSHPDPPTNFLLRVKPPPPPITGIQSFGDRHLQVKRCFSGHMGV